MVAKKTTRKVDKDATRNLLIELGVEELPPRALMPLANAFADGIMHELRAAGVVDAAGKYQCFATPRRLAVWVNGVAATQRAQVVERRGPSLQVAYDDDGKPSNATKGFAKSCGVAVAKLKTLKTDKGAWLVHRQKVAGLKLAEVVTNALAHSIQQLPIPKRMRWGNHAVEFVRPVHWLLVLHGKRVVKTEALGLKANRFTRGHRFYADRKLAIADADDYAATLKSNGKVIADFAQRRSLIQNQIERLAKQVNAKAQVDAELLDLVTALIELPTALIGAFDKRFLKIPDEVLISSMRDHQKYFHLLDRRGKLIPAFITVSNITSKARVRAGNERVLRARLTDAEFFWNSDLKTPLASRSEQLKHVLFHNKLGSLHDKSARLMQLAQHIAEQLQTDPEQAARAAQLCKLDLVTDMVGEFPELQGSIGRHYARKGGEDQVIADAIEQHYLPRYSGDKLPHDPIAQSVALADRLDSLIGIFASGEIPSGDKDPFGLRRAALGVLRIMIESRLDLDVVELLQMSCAIYTDPAHKNSITVTPNADTSEQVFDFMLDRLKAYYQPLGHSAAELASVMACRPTKPLDFDRRLKALSRFFKQQPEAADSLAVANKRIANILNKAKLRDRDAQQYDPSLFQQPAETKLAQQLDELGARARAGFGEDRYDDGFVALSKLKQPVDTFFDEVMVMHEDVAIRNNRLALLHQIRALFLDVADISHMGSDR